MGFFTLALEGIGHLRSIGSAAPAKVGSEVVNQLSQLLAVAFLAFEPEFQYVCCCCSPHGLTRGQLPLVLFVHPMQVRYHGLVLGVNFQLHGSHSCNRTL